MNVTNVTFTNKITWAKMGHAFDFVLPIIYFQSHNMEENKTTPRRREQIESLHTTRRVRNGLQRSGKIRKR